MSRIVSIPRIGKRYLNAPGTINFQFSAVMSHDDDFSTWETNHFIAILFFSYSDALHFLHDIRSSNINLFFRKKNTLKLEYVYIYICIFSRRRKRKRRLNKRERIRGRKSGAIIPDGYIMNNQSGIYLKKSHPSRIAILIKHFFSRSIVENKTFLLSNSNESRFFESKTSHPSRREEGESV